MFLKPSKNFTFFIFLFVLQNSPLNAQNQTNNMGKEFVFSFLENVTITPIQVAFAISCKTVPNKIFISTSAFTLPFTIFRKDTVISINNSFIPNAGKFINTSVRISSIEDISVTALNNGPNSSDMATITPVNKIPSNPVYYVNTFRGDKEAGSKSSQFYIVAIDDSCAINILPSADATVYGGNIIFFNLKDTLVTRMMRKNELMWLEASDSQSLGGSKIWNTNGCKKFAVFEGAKCSRILYETQCAGCDHLYNQSRPLQLLGKEYTSIPYDNLPMGFVLQVVATENNTKVSIDGGSPVIMNEREVYLFNNLNNKPNCIKADKKISVLQMMKSGICNGSSIGNPSIMTLLPDDQLNTYVQFSAPTTKQLSTTPAQFSIGITCPIANLSSILINNKPVDTLAFVKQCNKAVGIIRINSLTSYSIQSPKGFLAYLYASGNDESYATELGGGFESNVSKLTLVPDEAETCDTFNNFTFKASSDSLANYLWEFGDGTNHKGDSIVSKAYNKRGTFNLKLIVQYTNNKGCKADTFDRTITVRTRPYFEILKY
jgi:hypothetical protein